MGARRHFLDERRQWAWRRVLTSQEARTVARIMAGEDDDGGYDGGFGGGGGDGLRFGSGRGGGDGDGGGGIELGKSGGSRLKPPKSRSERARRSDKVKSPRRWKSAGRVSFQPHVLALFE